MKGKEIEVFEKLHGQMKGLHEEIGVLSKKTPGDALNPFKLRIINALLQRANALLTGKYQPLENFEVFDEDDVPTNSDVTMVIAQYLNCMETLRADNIETYGGRWYWCVGGMRSEIQTAPPKKLREK